MNETMNARLIHEATRGDIDEVGKLLKNGANVHIGNDAALRYAAKSAHVDVCILLIDYGCKSDVAVKYGTPEVIFAVRRKIIHDKLSKELSEQPMTKAAQLLDNCSKDALPTKKTNTGRLKL